MDSDLDFIKFYLEKPQFTAVSLNLNKTYGNCLYKVIHTFISCSNFLTFMYIYPEILSYSSDHTKLFQVKLH